MALIIHNDARNFSQSIQGFAANLTHKKARLVIQKVGMEALTRLVRKTPVDTGRARGNWQVSIGSPLVDYDDEKKDPSGGEAETTSGGMSVIMAGQGKMKDAPLDSVIWITNNVPYIEILDSGRSNQAPTGMLDSTMIELQSMFERDMRDEEDQTDGRGSVA